MRTAIASPDPDDEPEREVRRIAVPPLNSAAYQQAFGRALAEVESQYAQRGRAELYAALKPTLRGPLTEDQRAEIEKQFNIGRTHLSTAIARLRHHLWEAFLRQIENGGA